MKTKVTYRGKAVRVVRMGTLKVDLEAVSKIAGPLVVSDQVLRASKGIDVNGARHRGYSESYSIKLNDMGKRTDVVDFNVTGALMRSIQHRGTVFIGGIARITVAPGTGTSRQMEPRADGAEGMTPTGRRSPSHNVLAYYLQQQRNWFGLSKKTLDQILRAILRSSAIVKTE